MLKEDFTNGQAEKENQKVDQPHLAELEKKYEKELEDYEKKTHFMEEHENEFEDAPGSTISVEGSEKKKEKKNKMKSPSFSNNMDEAKDNGMQYSAESENETEEETFGETVMHTASHLIEKGKDAATEKAGELWDNVKSEWKRDKKAFAKKALVGAAVTGAAVGLLLLSTRKREKTFAEKLTAAVA